MLSSAPYRNAAPTHSDPALSEWLGSRRLTGWRTGARRACSLIATPSQLRQCSHRDLAHPDGGYRSRSLKVAELTSDLADRSCLSHTGLAPGRETRNPRIWPPLAPGRYSLTTLAMCRWPKTKPGGVKMLYCRQWPRESYRVGHLGTWKCPTHLFYCLSKTKVEVNVLPSALVPLVVVVMVLPPFEITMRLVA